ncbi:MAG: FAD-binding oxidoreductase [Candidatus Dormibacteria bacterium]
MLTSRLLHDLEGQVDRPHVYSRPADLAAYAFDAFGASGERHLPDAVVFPAGTAEVAGVMQVCAHHQVTVIPRGAGTGYAGGAVATQGGVILNLCRMSRVIGLERDAMRLHAEAGTITSTVHRRAAAVGLYYPPDPGASSTSTIGGNVACNAAGPHSLRHGATGDFLTGATAVLAGGQVLQLGELGAGDSALLSLLPASEGTLAVITDVLLRLVPTPAAKATLGATFTDMQAACAAAADISAAGIVPAAIEVMDEAALEAVARAGLGHSSSGSGALLLIEIEGDVDMVNSDGGAVRAALSTAGARHVEHATDAAGAGQLWRARKAISGAVAELMVGKVNEDVVVPRDRVSELIAATRQIGERHGVPVVNFGHLGEGNIHTTFLIDPRLAGQRQRGDQAADELFSTVLDMGGSISGEHGAGCTKLPHLRRQMGPAGTALMERIKAAYDPAGLLNPGKKVSPRADPLVSLSA